MVKYTINQLLDTLKEKNYKDNTKKEYIKTFTSISRLFGTEDFKEGTTAFLEKRKANFSGK